jgi:nitroreductase
MMLAATELGLGSVWICHFKPEVIRIEFNLPDHFEPVNILAIGFENEELGRLKPRTARKPIEETVFYETF